MTYVNECDGNPTEHHQHAADFPLYEVSIFVINWCIAVSGTPIMGPVPPADLKN